MTRNRVAEIEHCCWPGCSVERYHMPDAPPFCGNHLVKCATYVSQTMGMFVLDTRDPRRPWVPPAGQPLDAQEVVYYVRLGDRIKIGTTTNLSQRLSSLHVEPDALLAVELGGRVVERDRHAQFRDERVYSNRELFNPSRRLLAHIQSLTPSAALVG